MSGRISLPVAHLMSSIHSKLFRFHLQSVPGEHRAGHHLTCQAMRLSGLPQSTTGSETHSLGGVRRGDTLAVEEEAAGVDCLALTLAESFHELIEFRGLLDLEENLVMVVRHFNVEMLIESSLVLLLRGSLVRHVVVFVGWGVRSRRLASDGIWSGRVHD